ncbi:MULTISPECIES: aldolase/citrate lyase family protein [Pelosinus]|uniref:HpcH/HpaI aldolase n=1 Tax=Pelosinus fermentans B4 TaxID=1149862 RepID=I9LBT1_9FIRM|nr:MULTISPECIES: aldolase/citrate lyase family protein [Pelosinus]EIW17791.1 HpcH/HpaI aldolase [Pelosinus fermentans B4]EIW23753.1 HpcH/HpaI aldolase [Pelosinus fermentans A11]OAM94676.1 Citryl-CoA lyase [Pelosinus fermentans DSM 17108]SDR15162.1 citrate lyase subunit beta / citryl-CoA lyase [Pelosinus fermentans]
MEKLRRSMMFVPGNNPGMLQNAGIYGADTIILDCEDAVAITEKDSARNLVFQAISEMNYGTEVAVRINHISTPFGWDDLKRILPAKPDLIRLPMCQGPDEIRQIDEFISEAEQKNNFPAGSIKMMAAVETPKGLRLAYEIASASPRMVALAIGAEDFIANLKTTRSKLGRELLAARGQLVLAAREAGIQCIDTVFSDINDEEGFKNELELIKEMGFDGKSVVNPRQVSVVHDFFAPTAKEIDHAQRVLAAYQEALEKKSGVISLNGKMIDLPIVARAERTLAYAKATAGKGGK